MMESGARREDWGVDACCANRPAFAAFGDAMTDARWHSLEQDTRESLHHDMVNGIHGRPGGGTAATHGSG